MFVGKSEMLKLASQKILTAETYIGKDKTFSTYNYAQYELLINLCGKLRPSDIIILKHSYRDEYLAYKGTDKVSPSFEQSKHNVVQFVFD